tara:strand:+ start:1478 stop:2098 length:621 start_codon:yes stop_codon:yes gene_type:complete
MDRGKKIKIVQYSLLFFGILIIFLTYYSNNKSVNNSQILSKTTKENITKNIKNEKEKDQNTFFDIEYSGLDFSGNRYILKSEEAITNNLNSYLINLKQVNAKFYFKDGTILYVWSDYGIYNNQTLDMKFSENVKAIYGENTMNSENANYSNSESFLTITNNVKLNGIKGDLFADKLLFDIKKQTLDISSFNDNKINARIKVNEKRF